MMYIVNIAAMCIISIVIITLLKVIYDVVKSNYVHDVKVAKEKRAEVVRRVKSDYPKFFIDSEWKLRHWFDNIYSLNKNNIHSATIYHTSGLSAFMQFNLHRNDDLVLNSTFDILTDEERSVMLEYLKDLRNKLIRNFLDAEAVELQRMRQKKFDELK